MILLLIAAIAHAINLQRFRALLDHAQRLEVTCVRFDWMVRSTMTRSSVLFESLTTDEWYFWDGSSCTLASSTGLLLPEGDCAGPDDVSSLIQLDGCDHAAVTQSWLIPGLITTDTLTGRRRIPSDAISVEVAPAVHEFRIIWAGSECIWIDGIWYEERSGV